MVRFPRLTLIVMTSIMSILLSASSLFAGEITTVDYRPELGSNSPKLDIYSFDGAKNAPVLVYVHGGAWKWGSRRQVGQKPVHYNKSGFVFVSIDYRLVPKVKIEGQLEDVDHALGWITSNINKFGGNPDNLHLMGHSAGAHLVSMTGVAPGKNGRQLIDKNALRSVISNDTMTYNVPFIAAAKGGVLPRIYGDAFGQEPARWERLSPLYHVGELPKVPAFLVMYSGQRFARARSKLSQNFADLLRQANSRISVFDGSKFNHRQMTVLIGIDDELTEAIDGFLGQYK